MEPEFITYQKFNDVALANELAEQLKHHNIEYYIEEDSLMFNPSFALNDPLSKNYDVRIKSEDFEKVTRLLNQDESENVADVDKDYYLFGFTDDELMEVITKADEWSPFDHVLARKILVERGKIITDNDIEAINAKRIEELKVPEEPQTSWIVIGYFFALVGGLLGIFVGWHLMTYKKTLPDGERVYDYTENDRKHGRNIFYIGIVVLILFVGYKLSTVFV
jgi:hypothetical protein